MACAIDAAVGGANSNSYSTIVEADAYHDNHLYAADWTGATADNKCRALLMATRLLDEHLEWEGSPTKRDTQKLQWPRSGMVDLLGQFIADTVLPKALKDATAEFARQLIAANRTADSQTETESIKSLAVGPVTIDFGNPRAKVIPDSVYHMISQWGLVRSRFKVATELERT